MAKDKEMKQAAAPALKYKVIKVDEYLTKVTYDPNYPSERYRLGYQLLFNENKVVQIFEKGGENYFVVEV